MNVQIHNYCKKTYKLDAPNIIQHILEKIPGKFLVGLTEVRIFDPTKDKEWNIKYIHRAQQAIIEVYMDHSMEKRDSLFFRLLLNDMFIDAINTHIGKFVKPVSTDEEILTKPRQRFPVEWLYIGKLTFILRSVMKIWNYLYIHSQMCRNLLYYWIMGRQNKKNE